MFNRIPMKSLSPISSLMQPPAALGPAPMPGAQMPGMQPGIVTGPQVDEETTRFYKSVIEQAKKQAKTDAETSKYYLNLFKDGEFREGKGASSNHTFADVTLLMSVLLAHDPEIEVTPLAEGDLDSFMPLVGPMFPTPGDAQAEYADILEKVLKFIWVETRSNVHLNAALFNAIVTGMGVVKVSFDPKIGSDRIDALNREEIFIDPNARYDLTQARYVMQLCTLPIDEAKEFFRSIGAPNADSLEANYKLSEGDGLDGDLAKMNEPKDGNPRYFRFYEIWEKNGDDRRTLYRKYDKEEWIHVRPWPFVLAVDEFPFILIVFNQQYRQMADSFTDLHTVNGLRATYERIIEFYRRHVMKGIASKIVYDKSAFDSDAVDQMKDPNDQQFVPATLNGRKLDEVLQKVNFSEDAGVIIELANSVKAIRDEVLGISAITRGAEGKVLTAKQTEVQDKYGTQRLDRRQLILDAAIENICRKRAQIGLQLLAPEKIAKIAGQTGATMWQMFSGDVSELHCLYSISIVAGSAGEKSEQMEQDRLERFFKLAQAVNATQPMPVFDLVKIALRMLKLSGVAHPERYILAPVQPQALPPGAAGGPPNSSTAQGPNGVGPGGQAPPQTSPGEQEPGAGASPEGRATGYQ